MVFCIPHTGQFLSGDHEEEEGGLLHSLDVMIHCFQILHMGEGDTLDLRLAEGRAVYLLSLTINLTSPDY